jgi:hypothetical protein
MQRFVRLAALVTAIVIFPTFVNAAPSNSFYGYWESGCADTAGVYGVLGIPGMSKGATSGSFIGNNFEISAFSGVPAIRSGIRYTDRGYIYFDAIVYVGGSESVTLDDYVTSGDVGQLMATSIEVSIDGSVYQVGFETPHGPVGPFASPNIISECTGHPSWVQIEQVVMNPDTYMYAGPASWSYNSVIDTNYVTSYFTEPNGIEWNGPYGSYPATFGWYTLPSNSTTGGVFVACYYCQ